MIFFMFYFMEVPVIEDGPEEDFKMQKRLWAQTGLLMRKTFDSPLAIPFLSVVQSAYGVKGS
ncbi:MAG: hypothetical protein Q7I89_08480 [Syntrophales bacterium]|nr:hypothetical protein [Syntrophales bacterium]